VDPANKFHERLVDARLRSITAALKIVGQRDKSRHASGRDGDHHAAFYGWYSPHNIYTYTKSGLESVLSSRNQSEVGTCLYTGLEVRKAEEEEEQDGFS